MSSRNGRIKMTSQRRSPPNRIEDRASCRNGPERQQGIESRRCDETDRTPPPPLLSVAALLVRLLMPGNKLFPIAMSCPSMPVPPKPYCTTITLSNSISVGPRPLHPFCLVPNSAAPTTQSRQRMPPVMSWPSWKPCHPHRMNGWSCWNSSRPRRLWWNGFARRSRNGAIGSLRPVL